ncbi:MAG: hypothetical protein LCH39_13375, partial [Proteobacteria bacterium]|nr:hypothetical protein [Pseudomonadota bacterium]
MATQKKTTDPAEAALSAIEEALGIAPSSPAEPASSENALPSETKSNLPAEDFDIFAEQVLASATEAAPPPPALEEPIIKAEKPRSKAKAESKGTAQAKAGEPDAAAAEDIFKLDAAEKQPDQDLGQDLGGNEAVTLPVLPIIKPRMPEADKTQDTAAEAPRVAPRVNALPANDDRRANVAALLAPLQNPAPSTPLVWAGLASALWVGATAFVLTRSNGLLYSAEGSLRPGSEGLLALSLLGMLLPVLFFFSLAALQRRSRELKTSAQVMAEVAARLAEPEVAGSETVFTLGQAVRREVTSIGDGIERAVARAGELEGLVHGEVSALERSYADNEYKMRQLVTELAAEREAIMATAERIRLTIDAAHQGFSADIEKVSQSITAAVDDAGGRVHSLVGDKQTLLVATLETTAAMIGQVIDERAQDLASRLQSITMEATAGVDTARADLVAEINRAGSGIVAEMNQTGGTVTTTLSEHTRAMVEAMSATSSEVTSAITQTATQMTGTLDERARAMVEALGTTSTHVTGAIESTSSQMLGTLEERTAAVLEALGTTTGQLTGTLTDTATSVTASLDEQARTVAQSFHEAAAAATESFRDVTQVSTREITASLAEATGTFRTTGENLKAEFDETAQVVNSAFEANGRTIMEQVGARAVEINDAMRQVAGDLIDAMENRGIESAKLIEEKGGKIAEDISVRSEQLAERLLADGDSLARRLEANAEALVHGVTARGEELSERLITSGETLAGTLHTRAQGIIEDVTARGAEFTEQI